MRLVRGGDFGGGIQHCQDAAAGQVVLHAPVELEDGSVGHGEPGGQILRCFGEQAQLLQTMRCVCQSTGRALP